MKVFGADAFISGSKTVDVVYNGETVVFTAHALSYLERQEIALRARAETDEAGRETAPGKSFTALLIANAITDAEGNHFTYDEALRLKEEYAQPFLQAALEASGMGDAGDPEKK